MIQRVQSLYLLLALLAGVVVFIFPFAEIAGFEHTYIIKAFGVYINGSNQAISNAVFITALSFLVVLLPLITVLLYKKRKQQIRLCNATMLACLGLLFCVYYYQQATVSLTGTPEKTVVSYHISSLMPIVQIILLFLARRAIKKDDELIKSVDRLR